MKRFALIALLGCLNIAADKLTLDLCEIKLRNCFGQCVSKADGKTCNHTCVTSLCEGMSGPEQTLTEFLSWRRTRGRIWL